MQREMCIENILHRNTELINLLCAMLAVHLQQVCAPPTDKAQNNHPQLSNKKCWQC